MDVKNYRGKEHYTIEEAYAIGNEYLALVLKTEEPPLCKEALYKRIA